MNTEFEATTVAAVRRIVGAHRGSDVSVTRVDVLKAHKTDDPNVLAAKVGRAWLTDGTSVIVKLPKRFVPYRPDLPGGPASAVMYEWAGLQFVGRVLPDERRFPQLLGGDRELGVLVLMDFGDVPNLSEWLDQYGARATLVELADLLGRMHGATVGRKDEWTALRQSFGPREDTHWWVERMWSLFREVAAQLGIDDVAAVSDAPDFYSDLSHWGAFCHTEPAHENVIVSSGTPILIDFDCCAWSNSLVEAALFRTGFGHLPAHAWLEHGLVEACEREYIAARRTSDAAFDVAAFERDMLWAVAWLSAENLGHWGRHALTEEYAPWSGGIRARRHLRMQWQLLRRLGDGTRVGAFAHRVLDAMARAWPDDGVLPLYKRDGA